MPDAAAALAAVATFDTCHLDKWMNHDTLPYSAGPGFDGWVGIVRMLPLLTLATHTQTQFCAHPGCNEGCTVEVNG
jgi:hypothetical protein